MAERKKTLMELLAEEMDFGFDISDDPFGLDEVYEEDEE